MSNNVVILSKDDFNSLFKILSILNDRCSDCDIFEGILRQNDNTNKLLICSDLTDLIGNLSLVFDDVKKTLSQLSIFKKSDKVTIKVTDNHTLFSDSISKFEIRSPLTDYLYNKFVTDEDFNTKVESLRENKIFNITIDSTLIERINKMSSTLGDNVIDIFFKNNKISLLMSERSKTRAIKLKSDIDTEKDIKDMVGQFTASIFGIKSKKIEIAGYLHENLILFEFTLDFGGTSNPILYSRTQIQY